MISLLKLFSRKIITGNSCTAQIRWLFTLFTLFPPKNTHLTLCDAGTVQVQCSDGRGWSLSINLMKNQCVVTLYHAL